MKIVNGKAFEDISKNNIFRNLYRISFIARDIDEIFETKLVHGGFKLDIKMIMRSTVKASRMLYKSESPDVIALAKSFEPIYIIFLGNNDVPLFEIWEVVIHSVTSYISLYGVDCRDERLLLTPSVFCRRSGQAENASCEA